MEYSESEQAFPVRTGTASKIEFTIVYDDKSLLPETDMNAILTYFDTYFGTFFDWIDPQTGLTHNVIHVDTEFEYNEAQYKMGWYSTTYKFREK